MSSLRVLRVLLVPVHVLEDNQHVCVSSIASAYGMIRLCKLKASSRLFITAPFDGSGIVRVVRLLLPDAAESSRQLLLVHSDQENEPMTQLPVRRANSASTVYRTSACYKHKCLSVLFVLQIVSHVTMADSTQ
jgi:hypothetical protein